MAVLQIAVAISGRVIEENADGQQGLEEKTSDKNKKRYWLNNVQKIEMNMLR